MTVRQIGKSASGFSPINKNLKKEILSDLLGRLRSINDVKRTSDSIVLSDNFHLDSKLVDNYYKVDVQYRSPKQGSTVAQVRVLPDASSLQELIKAFTESLRTGMIYEVS